MTIESNEIYLLLCFALPLLAMVGAVVIRFPNVRDVFTVLVSMALFANMLQILSIFQAGDTFSYELVQMLPGLHIAFSLEPMGMIFALIVSFLWIVSSVYSIGYMRGNSESHQSRFYAFFALSIFAALGIAFSANLLTLFLFYEFLTICTFPLVTHSGTVEAKRSGRVYLGVLMGTSVMLFLPAIIITYYTTGTLDFTSGGIFAGKVDDSLAAILLGLYMFGIGKAALMPMHKWLPAAMVAPTPVSALLHAVAVVKAGVFTIVKVIVYIFGIDYLQDIVSNGFWYGQWLLYISGFTIMAASIVAMRQDNLKKRLAYSTVSQLSYVTMAAAILSPLSIIGAVFHIAAHAFGKITLFFAAGSIYTSAHKTKVSQLSGIGAKMPWTMAAFTIAALSMIGVPPMIGFISKWYMVSGAFDRDSYIAIAVIAVSTLLNAAYFLPIIYKAFFEKEKISTGVTMSSNYGEAPVAIVISLMITAIATFLLFIHPGIFLELAKAVVE